MHKQLSAVYNDLTGDSVSGYTAVLKDRKAIVIAFRYVHPPAFVNIVFKFIAIQLVGFTASAQN